MYYIIRQKNFKFIVEACTCSPSRELFSQLEIRDVTKNKNKALLYASFLNKEITKKEYNLLEATR